MTGDKREIIDFLIDQDQASIWDLEPHKPKRARSLDSNAYFHLLVQKLAQAQCPPISLAHCKNEMIAAYGQPEYINDTQVIIKSNIPVEKMRELEYLHTACIKVTQENNTDVYFYRVYRGSHTYNTKEMSVLIAGVVQECNSAGIETATPDELAKMNTLWEQKYEKHNRRQ